MDIKSLCIGKWDIKAKISHFLHINIDDGCRLKVLMAGNPGLETQVQYEQVV